jgi:hypothetical protein
MPAWRARIFSTKAGQPNTARTTSLSPSVRASRGAFLPMALSNTVRVCAAQACHWLRLDAGHTPMYCVRAKSM